LFFFCVALSINLSAGVSSSADEPSRKSISQKYILDNGMTVLIKDMPENYNAGLYALVKTGSATEGGLMGSGVSHFLEHMLFKGSDKRKVGEIGQEVKALGGIINASTSFDYTVYYIDLPAENFDKALDILADMLMNSRVSPEDVESEREVILGEMRMHNDRPERKLSEQVFRNVYVRHPYRHPIIGYKPVFLKLTRDDLWRYYQEQYNPNNIVFSVAGPMDPDQTLAKIKDKFKDFQPQAYLSRNLPKEPQQITARYYEAEYPTDVARLSMAYQSVSILDRDLFALDVLAMILGRGRSSRLYQQLKEKDQLVQRIYVSNFTPMDKGVFEVECFLLEGNLEKTIQAVKREIEEVKAQGVLNGELEKAKRQVLRERIDNMQMAPDVAYQAAIDEAFTGDPGFSLGYVDGIRMVTNEDIVRVAKIYLRDSNLTTVVLRPQNDTIEKGSERDQIQKGEIERIELDNGLTLLLRDDKTVPLVFMGLYLNGGSRQEPEDKTGLSELTSRLWVKETKSMSVEELAKSIESLAARLSSFSGRNSFGLEYNSLSEDWLFGLDLMETLIKNPVFSDDQLKKEKDSLLRDIVLQKDEISYQTAQTMKETLFASHYLKFPLLGTEQSVASITLKDIRNFYQTLTIPDNMVITVFGDIQRDEVIEAIKAEFSGLKNKPLALSDVQPSALSTPREKEIAVNKEQAMVMIGFQGPDLYSEDCFDLEIITAVMGSSLSGRMFDKIRDELGQAYTLGAQLVPAISGGFIYFYVNTTSEQVDKVTEILSEQIARLSQEMISDQELEESKNYRQGLFARGLEANNSFKNVAGFDELYNRGYEFYKNYDRRIDAVSKDDVLRAAQKYLDLSKAVIVKARPNP
jgi:zinc protease